jgi:hypothetical protein
VFVALIDTRPRWEPNPEPEPIRRRWPDVPWRALATIVLVIALFVAVNATRGIVAYGLLLVALTTVSLAIDRAFSYRLGLTEYRQ